MSEADKMFDELGYIKKFENERKAEYRYIKKIMGDLFDFSIIFSKVSKIVVFQGQEGFSMEELKAINKKCEELGWL